MPPTRLDRGRSAHHKRRAGRNCPNERCRNAGGVEPSPAGRQPSTDDALKDDGGAPAGPVSAAGARPVCWRRDEPALLTTSAVGHAAGVARRDDGEASPRLQDDLRCTDQSREEWTSPPPPAMLDPINPVPVVYSTHPRPWDTSRCGERMIHESTVELQSRRDICQAVFLIALAQGLTRDQSVDALRYQAATKGLSLHATALAVLVPKPADELPIARPARTLTRRHLQALRSPAAEQPTAVRN